MITYDIVVALRGSPVAVHRGIQRRHQLSGYSAHRVPSIFPASSFMSCLNSAVLKCGLPWRTRYPLS